MESNIKLTENDEFVVIIWGSEVGGGWGWLVLCLTHSLCVPSNYCAVNNRRRALYEPNTFVESINVRDE